MYKNLSIALLLVAFALAAAHSVGHADTSLQYPIIVKKLIVRNHSGPIESTTLYTPSQTGLFRVSIYMTETTPGQPENLWRFSLSAWSDDAGPECCVSIVGVDTASSPPNAFGGYAPQIGTGFPPGGTAVIQAIGGQPIKYSVDNNVPGTTGTYSLFVVVERLI